jgi:hypothetical protein
MKTQWWNAMAASLLLGSAVFARAQAAPVEPAAPANTGSPDAPESAAHAPAESAPVAAAPPEAAAPVAASEPAAVAAPMPVAPAPDPEPETPAGPNAGYKKGFFIQSDDGQFRLEVGARFQARYAFEAIEAAPNESNFSIARARFTLGGHVFTEDLTYKFQTDFGKGFVTLKDFYADYAFVPGAFQLRAGQWKRPFSRQQITSSGKQELVDRATTDAAFGAGRDIGIAVHNDYEDSPELEYAFGIFNGTGEKPVFSGDATVDPMTGEGPVSGAFTNVPDTFHPALVLRAGYNHGGIKGYSEADLEGGPFRAAVGASGLVDLDADDDDTSSLKAELDYLVKVEGFSSTGGLYVSSAQSGTGFGDRAFEALGMHLQLGYVIGELVQPVARYSLVAPDGGDNDTHEILGGLGFYFWGHEVKWQTDGGALLSEAPGGTATDYRVRTQLQLAF